MDEEDIKTLQTQPSILQLEIILRKDIANPAQYFKVVNVLITNIISIFDDLTLSLQRQIISIFTSLVGISSLINHLNLCTSDTKALATKYLHILTKIIDNDGILYNLILKESSGIKIKEIKSLFFGSKLLNVYSKFYVEYNIQQKYAVRLIFMDKLKSEFLILLENNFCQYHYLSELLAAYLRLNESDSFLILDQLLTPPFVNQLYNIYKNGKSNKSLVLASVVKYLDFNIKTNPNHDEQIQWMSHFDLDFATLESASCVSQTSLLRVMILSLDNSKKFEYCMRLLQIWGNSSYINKTPLSIQESHTTLLVVLILAIEISDIQRISQDQEFLASITNRISSTSTRIRSFGILIGNLIFQKMGKDPIFKIEEELQFGKEFLKKIEDDATSPTPVDLELIRVEHNFDRMVVQDSDEDDDDLEDSDDDPTIADRSKPNKPLFLKELVSYLNADSNKDKHAYDKRKLALVHGPKLILRSPVKNLRFFNDSLVSLFIGLNNDHEDPDFDDLRLKCLISCVVHDPLEGPSIILRSFIGGDYSLQQRLTLLSTLSLAARYLRGYSDSSFNVDLKKVEFRSKMLPPEIHRQFLELGSNQIGLTNLIGTSIESEIIEETLSKNKDKLMGEGQILRISSKLTKPRDRSSALIKTRIPDFYKIVSSRFFFPLTTVWFTLDQEGTLKMGKFSAILAAHFLKSIGLILHTAFPSAADIQDIVKESLNVVLSVCVKMFRIKQGDENNDQLLILDSILFIVLVILDSSNDQFLVNFFLNELVSIKNFIVGLLNEELDAISVDDKLVQKCFTVTFRLNEIFEKFERLLIGVDGI